MKWIIVACMLLSGLFAGAQDRSWDISDPIDVKDVAYPGRNLVRCTENGNTVVFHIPKDDNPEVIVYDKMHKKIADVRNKYRYFRYEYAYTINGLFEINNEVVMFVDLEINSRHTLIRLRYNSVTGGLAEETIVSESKGGIEKRKYFICIHYRNENRYEILYFNYERSFKRADISLEYFDSLHHSVRKLQLPADVAAYDNVQLAGVDARPTGVFIVLSMVRTQVYARGGSSTILNDNSNTDDHLGQFMYIADGAANARTVTVDLGNDVYPVKIDYDHNAFAQAVNLLLFSYKRFSYGISMGQHEGTMTRHLFFRMDEHDISAMKMTEITNRLADAYLKEHTDSTKVFVGETGLFRTNDNGLSTFINVGVNTRTTTETSDANARETNYENIAITQLDDDGNEIWATVLPFSQYYNSYRTKPYYFAGLAGVYKNRTNDDYFLIYNDLDKNFNKKLGDRIDTVFDYFQTNACYYKFDKKRNITKYHLFGDPVPGESRAAFVSSGCYFDERTRTFVSLVQCKKGDDITFRVGWSKLE